LARVIPPDRYHELLEAATTVFIAQGYRGTQMRDVAQEMGLSSGTLYGYVVSKEALFAEVLLYADTQTPVCLPSTLPVEVPPDGTIANLMQQRLGTETQRLEKLLERMPRQDIRKRLVRFFSELYRTLDRNRTAIKVLDRCAREHRELAAIWYPAGRFSVLNALTAFLESRSRSRSIRRRFEPALSARTAMEIVNFWALHRHWDASPQTIDESAVEQNVVELALAVLLKDDTKNPQ